MPPVAKWNRRQQFDDRYDLKQTGPGETASKTN